MVDLASMYHWPLVEADLKSIAVPQAPPLRVRAPITVVVALVPVAKVSCLEAVTEFKL